MLYMWHEETYYFDPIIFFLKCCFKSRIFWTMCLFVLTRSIPPLRMSSTYSPCSPWDAGRWRLRWFLWFSRSGHYMYTLSLETKKKFWSKIISLTHCHVCYIQIYIYSYMYRTIILKLYVVDIWNVTDQLYEVVV